jgi:hypothetical protein
MLGDYWLINFSGKANDYGSLRFQTVNGSIHIY